MRHITLLVLFFSTLTVNGQSPLFIPPTLTGTSFILNVQAGSRTFFTGYSTPTYGINGAFLAPTLIVNKGDSVNLAVTNALSVNTTLHWHGLHVPAIYDGGPGQVILAGSTWNPGFKIMNDAGTYWYHPHGDGKTDLQVSKGIAGLIIVKDPVEASLTLPRTYGVDDFPLIVQSKAFDVLRQIAIATEDDTVMMVNGTINPFLDAPAQVVRFRMLNGSSMRSYQFGFSGNLPFKLIATDDGLLDSSVTLTRIRLSPGERVEVLLDLSGLLGQTIYFKNFGSELSSGIYGSSVAGTGAAVIPGYNLNPLNGADYNILKINVVAATSSPVTTLPTTLATLSPWPLASVDTTRTFSFDPKTLDSTTFAEGPFNINGKQFDMSVVDVVTHLNHTEIWKLVNNTMIAHPFHIHDVYFYILDINGVAPLLFERGKKDVVLVMPGDTVRFITKFENYADASTPYMYHCHLLHHEDDGMMGQFVVMPDNTSVTSLYNTEQIRVYPNPATTSINISIDGISSAENANIVVYDAIGKEVCSGTFINHIGLNTEKWAKGFYSVSIIFKNSLVHRKFVIE
jgi:blue copper oxidase